MIDFPFHGRIIMVPKPSCLLILAMLTAASSSVRAQDASNRVEINVLNNRPEAVTMKFEYAFRQYKWKMMEHVIDGGDDVPYRFPANIPGCERLREWHITDGVLSINNDKGLICEQRISLCDRVQMTMDVRPSACYWTGK